MHDENQRTIHDNFIGFVRKFSSFSIHFVRVFVPVFFKNSSKTAVNWIRLCFLDE